MESIRRRVERRRVRLVALARANARTVPVVALEVDPPLRTACDLEAVPRRGEDDARRRAIDDAVCHRLLNVVELPVERKDVERECSQMAGVDRLLAGECLWRAVAGNNPERAFVVLAGKVVEH